MAMAMAMAMTSIFSNGCCSSLLFACFSLLIIFSSDQYCYAALDNYSNHQLLRSTATPPPPPPVDTGILLIINKTCESTVYFDLCVTTLIRTDPPSYKGAWDLPIPLISVQLSLSNVTDTRHFIKKLLKNLNNKVISSAAAAAATVVTTLKETLEHCYKDYGLAIHALKSWFKNYKDQEYFELVDNVDYARRNVSACVDYAFKKTHGGLYPFIQKRNTIALQLLTISHDLTKNSHSR